MSLAIIKDIVTKFRDDRDWKQFHNPKDLAAAIAIEASELQEHFLWKSKDESYWIGKSQDAIDEFADIFNYLILYADTLDIDIEKAISNKIKENNLKYPVEKAKGNSDKYNKL